MRKIPKVLGLDWARDVFFGCGFTGNNFKASDIYISLEILYTAVHVLCEIVVGKYMFCIPIVWPTSIIDKLSYYLYSSDLIKAHILV